MPQRHVLQRRERIAAHQPGEPGEVLGEDGVPLVGHGRAALLPGAERLLHLADLGALQVADLHRELLQAGRQQRQRAEVLGVAVALDDLARGRSAADRPSSRQACSSTAGGRWAKVPTAPEIFPTAMVARARTSRSRPRRSSSYQMASLCPKDIGSAWMPWLRPIITVRRCSKARVLTAAITRSTPATSSICRVAEHHRQRGVEHVGGGHPEVQPARGGADPLLHEGEEGDDVVPGGALDLVDARGVRRRRSRRRGPGTGPARRRGRCPRCTMPSSAASSTSRQRRSRAGAVHSATISGRA